jgi:hypothetical protein
MSPPCSCSSSGRGLHSTCDWGWEPGPEETAALIDPGTGGLERVFPRDLGVEVSGRGVDPESPPEGFLKGVMNWISPNYRSAPRHLTLNLDRGGEELRFRWQP